MKQTLFQKYMKSKNIPSSFINIKEKNSTFEPLSKNHNTSYKKNKVGMQLKINFDTYDIIIVTPFYKREDVFKIFLKNLNKNQKEGINLHAILIGSNSIPNERELVESYGFEYQYHQNKPLSNKWNYGLSFLKKYDFKYLLVLGSDDIISSNLISRVYNELNSKNYEVGGIIDIYFYHLKENIGIYWPGYAKTTNRFGEPLGAGRFYSKKLLEDLNYRLWKDGLNSSLDSNVYSKIRNKKMFTTKMLENEYLIDIKGGDEQITSFNSFKNFEKVTNLI